MGKIVKATKEQKAEYQKGNPCYPLYGYITLDGVKCVIEDLRCWSKDDPQYEVMAPDGHIFFPEHLHSLLCMTLEDIKGRTGGETIVPCKRPCDWCGAT